MKRVLPRDGELMCNAEYYEINMILPVTSVVTRFFVSRDMLSPCVYVSAARCGDAREKRDHAVRRQFDTRQYDASK